MRLLLAPDPVDPATPPAPGTPPAAPASPATVNRNPIKHPAVIALEKRNAALEDEIADLKSWKDEVNTTLEGLNIGGPPKAAPVKVKPGTVPAIPPPNTPPTPTPKSFGQIVDEDIWGTAPKA